MLSFHDVLVSSSWSALLCFAAYSSPTAQLAVLLLLLLLLSS